MSKLLIYGIEFNIFAQAKKAVCPGKGYFLVKDYWGCAAGWGRIFTTGLTIMGFSRVTRMGSQIFEIFGMRKFW